MARVKKKVKDFQFENHLFDLSETELKSYVGSLFNHVSSLAEKKKEDKELKAIMDEYKALCAERYVEQLKDYKSRLMLARGVMKLRGIQGVKEIDEIISKTKDDFLVE